MEWRRKKNVIEDIHRVVCCVVYSFIVRSLIEQPVHTQDFTTNNGKRRANNWRINDIAILLSTNIIVYVYYYMKIIWLTRW